MVKDLVQLDESLTTGRPDVSLIVPGYNEGSNIRAFYDATIEAFREFEGTYEIVFIDDGSSDDTYEQMKSVAALADGACTVVAVSFSRNFGKEAAMLAGLNNATGRCMGFVDADLQQPPKTFLEMYNMLIENPDVDCVAAYQADRRSGWLRNKLSHFFYGTLAKSSNMDVLTDASDFRVFRDYVGKALAEMPEQYRFSKGLFSWIGFKTLPFSYTPEERFSGETSWSFIKLVRYAIDGLLSFTTSPLKLATYLGVITSLVAIVYLIVVVLQRLIYGVDVPGYATIVVLLLFFGGLQLLVLGIMGSYLARSYIEGKRRPVYIERRVVKSTDDKSSAAAASGGDES